MRRGHTNRILQGLFGPPPIDSARIGDILRRSRATEAEDIALANSIIDGAGDYLPPSLIWPFIRADIDDDLVLSEISEQKKFVERLCSLLFEFLEHFKIKNERQALGALGYISDCHYDFQRMRAYQRRDRNKREILETFRDSIRSIEQTIGLLESLEWPATSEFAHIRSVFAKKLGGEGQEYSLENLIGDLRTCKGSIEISLQRSQNEEDYLLVPHNQVRTYVVERLHFMSQLWSGPAITTTPNSTFSFLCSLLFEIVSGESDVSLAGAINRYSRSEKRLAADRENEEFIKSELEDMNDTDNFIAINDEVARLRLKARKYERLLNSNALEKHSKTLAKFAFDAANERIADLLNEHGPHIVYASQLGANAFAEASNEEILSTHLRIKELSIAIGQRRRQASRKTST